MRYGPFMLHFHAFCMSSCFAPSNLKCRSFPHRYFGSNQNHQEIKIGLFPIVNHDSGHNDTSSISLHHLVFFPARSCYLKKQIYSESQRCLLPFISLVLYLYNWYSPAGDWCHSNNLQIPGYSEMAHTSTLSLLGLGFFSHITDNSKIS